MVECFICMETDNQLYKVCRCDTVVHAMCLQRLVNNTPSHSTNCPVCRQAYNITVTKVKKCRPVGYISKSTCNMTLLCIVILNSSFGLFIFINPYKEKFLREGNSLVFYIIISISLSLALSSVLCIVILLVNHFKVTGYLCCYRRINIIISRKINLSSTNQVCVHSNYSDELEV